MAWFLTRSRSGFGWLGVEVSATSCFEVEVAMKMNKQSGQVLIGVALGLVVLAGFAGLAIDMGALRYERRLQQTAADAAALSAASNLVYSLGVTLGARNASTANGFTDTDNGGGCTSNAQGCV